MPTVLGIGLTLDMANARQVVVEPPAPPTSTAFVTAYTPGTARNDASTYVGFKFTVGASPITVTDLGRWKIAGNTGSHAVHVTNAAGLSLGSVTIDTTLGSAGAFQYGTLSSPVVISAGTGYAILSLEASGGDQWYSNDGTLTPTAVATIGNSCYTSALNAGLNLDGGANKGYVPTSFKYQ